MIGTRWAAAIAASFACAVVASDVGSVLDSPSLDQPASAAIVESATLPLSVYKNSRLGGDLLGLRSMLAAHPLMTAQQLLAAFPQMSLSSRGSQPMVALDITAKRDPAALAAALEALGASRVSIYGRMLSARLPVSALGAMDLMPELLEARPVLAQTDRGAFVSQGDFALRAPLIRPPVAAQGPTGAGITVGVLSDSFGCLTTQPDAAADVAAGEFDPVNVLKELPGCTGGTDEGRAMVQLIADVAPGSRQSFYTAFDGQADFANGIGALIDAGARVVVDDVRYFAEPSFQDGIVAQAVDAAFARGVPYFSSAGNTARQSLESEWRSSTTGARIDPGSTGIQFDFDPGPNQVTRQQVTIPNGARLSLALQWDEPYASIAPGAPGSASDIDIYLLNAAGGIVALSAANNVGGDPFEFLNYTNNTGVARTLFVVIDVFSGPVPGRVKYVNYGTSTIPFAFPTNSATALGHTAAAGAFSSGAAGFFNTNACYGGPTILETFSSRGGTPILRTPDGVRLATPIIRQKPDAVGPDGANTSFFGQVFNVPASARPIVQCQDTDGRANNFFGTSAAAPHLAAVAALLRQQAPFATATQIYDAMRSTAEDILAPGPDFDSGFGFVRAPLALAAAVDFTPDAVQFVPLTNAPFSTTVSSNSVTISGITAPSPVSVGGSSSAEYSINGGAFTQAAGTVVPGDTVRLRTVSAQAAGATLNINLAIGPTISTWAVTTGADTTPNPIEFPIARNVLPLSRQTSIEGFVTGINVPVPITLGSVNADASAEYSLNGAPFTRAAGTARAGDRIVLRLRAPLGLGQSAAAQVRVGETIGSFTVVTVGALPAP